MDPMSVLDMKILDLDARLGVCLGSIEEVERCKEHIFSA